MGLGLSRSPRARARPRLTLSSTLTTPTDLPVCSCRCAPHSASIVHVHACERTRTARFQQLYSRLLPGAIAQATPPTALACICQIGPCLPAIRRRGAYGAQ